MAERQRKEREEKIRKEEEAKLQKAMIKNKVCIQIVRSQLILL